MYRNDRNCCLMVCLIGLILITYGCDKDRAKESAKEDEVRSNMNKLPLRITNSGSKDIDTLKINYNYDANSCIIKGLKSGQVVFKELKYTGEKTTMDFVIEYETGEVIKNNLGEMFLEGNQEFQIAIEDNGKMYFR